jgi:hypothetical protein
MPIEPRRRKDPKIRVGENQKKENVNGGDRMGVSSIIDRYCTPLRHTPIDHTNKLPILMAKPFAWQKRNKKHTNDGL